MVLSGPPTPVGGAQSVNPSLLRSNSSSGSGLLGGGAQQNPVPNQQPYSSLVSPRTQFNGGGNNSNSMSLLGSMSNPSLLIGHSIGNGVNLDNPLGFANSGDHGQFQQIEGGHNFHQQNISIPHQQQMRAGLGSVKLEPQMGSVDQNGGPGPSSQQLHAMRGVGVGAVKLEPQQLQSGRGLGPVKTEQQHLDSSLFLQQQQQQQLLQISRQSPQNSVQMNLLHQQRMLQLQQQQQQQLLKGLPPRAQLQQQHQQIPQNLPLRTQLQKSSYEPGVCARRLTQYMYHQQHRPQDNNIEFWRKFVAEFFAPNAKKRWCVSLYGSGRQTTGVFPQDAWHCEICNRKPGRGFETTAEVLPRLCQIKYASGTLEELFYIDMPLESHNKLGQTVLDYSKATQESVFEQLRVIRDGHLRIVFNSDLKISSWEFCARKHEELIPRRLIIPQISQLGTVVQKYQSAIQNSSSALSAQDLQNSCNSFVASARQLAKALEVPLVNDLGYTKRYVRCLQISEVVNSMKDLIDYSKDTGTGPMESLINFPRRNSSSSGLHPQQQAQQSEEHQQNAQNPMNSHPNGVSSINNSINGPSSTPSTTTIASILHHQNSMNSRQEGSQMGSTNTTPYGGGTQMPSTSSTNSLPQSQPNPSSPFSPPTPSTSNNNMIPTSRNLATHLNSVTSPANMPDLSDSHSSVPQILQEMMSSSPMNEMKGMNGNSGINGGMGFESMSGVGPMATVGGLRAAMVNNGLGMNGRVGVGMSNNHMSQNVMALNHHQRQQQSIMGNQLIGGVGSVNNFNNLHFDWKPSP